MTRRSTKLLLWTLAASLGVGAARAEEKFTFALNWFPVGDHAAYWVALDRGYFKQRGLDVTLENSKGSGDVIAKVDTGRADAGVADAAVVIASLARGAQVKAVGMVFDKTPLNFFSLKSSPALKPKDLEGRTIGAPPGDGQRQMWPAFAKLAGVDPDKVTWVNIEPAAKTAALAEKRVDAIGDYTTGLPLHEKATGAGGIVMMPWVEFGFDMYSLSLVASDKTMKARAPALRGFLEAAYLGWRVVMQDPKAAMAIFKKQVPEIDVPTLEANMMMGLQLMKTQRYAEHGIGWIEEKKMCQSVELVNTYMGLPKQVACRAVFTNEFLTKVDLPASMR